MPHIADGELAAWLDGAGGLAEDQQRTIETHLSDCADCRRRLEAARRLRNEATEILGLAVPREAATPSLDELLSLARGEIAEAGRGAAEARSSRGPSGRLLRLAWAASLVMAVGAGWIGNELLQEAQDRGAALGEIEEAAPAMRGRGSMATDADREERPAYANEAEARARDRLAADRVARLQREVGGEDATPGAAAAKSPPVLSEAKVGREETRVLQEAVAGARSERSAQLAGALAVNGLVGCYEREAGAPVDPAPPSWFRLRADPVMLADGEEGYRADMKGEDGTPGELRWLIVAPDSIRVEWGSDAAVAVLVLRVSESILEGRSPSFADAEAAEWEGEMPLRFRATPCPGDSGLDGERSEAPAQPRRGTR